MRLLLVKSINYVVAIFSQTCQDFAFNQYVTYSQASAFNTKTVYSGYMFSVKNGFLQLQDFTWWRVQHLRITKPVLHFKPHNVSISAYIELTD